MSLAGCGGCRWCVDDDRSKEADLRRRASMAANRFLMLVSPARSRSFSFLRDSRSRASRVKISAGSLISPSSKKPCNCLWPRPSMSKAHGGRRSGSGARSAGTDRRIRRCGGAPRSPAPPARWLLPSRCQLGVRAGMGNGWGNSERGPRPPARSSSTGPSTCGITSPARWTMTMSPTRTSLRAISSALCRVAFSTTTPPTVTGSSRATGVTAPVRPTWMSMACRIVRACSAGNLRGDGPSSGERETKPRRVCQSRRSTL